MRRVLLRPVPDPGPQATPGQGPGLDRERLAQTLREAKTAGTRGLDAAFLGSRDLVLLGRTLSGLPDPGGWQVYLGLGPDLDWGSHRAVVQALEDRLNQLGRTRVQGLFLLGPGAIQAWNQGLGRTVQGLKAVGLASWAGLAATNPDEARRALDLAGPERLGPEQPGPDLLRIRAGVLDHAMEEAGVPSLARERGVALVVEDVFLSGLLLCSPGRPGLGVAGELLALLDREAEDLGLERVSLVLGYLAQAMPGAFMSLEAFGPDLVRHAAEALARQAPPQLADRVRLTLRAAGEAISRSVQAQ